MTDAERVEIRRRAAAWWHVEPEPTPAPSPPELELSVVAATFIILPILLGFVAVVGWLLAWTAGG